MTIDKHTSSKGDIKDYLRLPFEVHYHHLSYTSLELLSDVRKIKKPSNFKGIQVEQGNARGVTFYCAINTGAELVCCLTSSHGETCPDWLSLLEEEDMNMNHGERFGIEIDGNCLNLQAESSDDLEDLVESGYSTGLYRLEEESIDYIILDADGDRIKIDESGYAIEINETDDEGQLVIDIESLSEDESLSDYSSLSNSEAQDMWIKEVWGKAFPTLPALTISKYAT